MSEKPSFSVDIGGLKRREKERDEGTIARVDKAGEELGFIERAPKKRRGRPKSPRTGQVHAKVLPHISDEISSEAKRRGVQQGVLIEEAWEMYKSARGLR